MIPTFPAVPVDDAMLETVAASAQRAADAAAAQTLPRFRVPISVDNKAAGGEFDPVTEADRDAETAIRQVLLGEHPDFGFLGEETPVLERSGVPVWVVDPIDGTRAFITGVPLWGTLIALYDGNDAIFGLMDQPFMQERLIGDAEGTRLISRSETRAVRARQGVALADAVFQTTTPDLFVSERERAVLDVVRSSVSLTRYGGDCYAYALLAMGYVDIVVECGLKPYDIQALIPIVRGAGGVITNWEGGTAVQGGEVLACASASLHAEMLARIDAAL